MSKPTSLAASLELLTRITEQVYNADIKPVALAIWRKHLQPENPVWKHLVVRAFSVDSADGAAHVMAMVDERLPGKGLVGYFGCTTPEAGVEVLAQAKSWLKSKHGIADVYGPINGTITSDYRFNRHDDYQIPGEPVNPAWYIDVFEQAGFTVFNRYVSGISKHYQLLVKLLTAQKPSATYAHLILRPFRLDNQMADFRIYHELMNAIFPDNSIYCPVLTFEERVYNMADKDPIFDPDYTYFLEDGDQTIGFIVAYPYRQNLIVKTIGILPAYRHKHLSNLLIKKVHDQAAQDGLRAAIYATVRVGNAVYKMKRPGVRAHRQYVTLHANL